jgi:hypothetical protein
MKHVVAAALALAGSFSVPLLGQQSPRQLRMTMAAAPRLRFRVDEEFFRLPDNIWPSEAVGVALNANIANEFSYRFDKVIVEAAMPSSR